VPDTSVTEEWRPVSDHPGYEVSSLGRVRSVDRTLYYPSGKWGRITAHHHKGRILIPRLDKDGYSYVCLGGGPRNTFKVHVLVCTTFHGPKPSPDHEVAHGDGDRGNAAAYNVRWATYAENREDMIRHGNKLERERHPRSKVSQADVRKAQEYLALGFPHTVIAKIIGCSKQTISLINLGKHWAV
jgi:hypothetical protein